MRNLFRELPVLWINKVFVLSFVTVLAGPVSAEVWRLDGNWVISASPQLGGCTMATKNQTGAFISVSSVATGMAGERTWELLVSEDAWFEIQHGATYHTTIRFLGASDTTRDIAMTGVNTRGTHAAISTALMIQVADQSEVTSFIVEGLKQANRIELLLDGRLIGSYALTHADLAIDAVRECIVSRAANFEA